VVNETPENSLNAKALQQEAKMRVAAEERNGDVEYGNEIDRMGMEDLRRELKLSTAEREIQAEALTKSQGETADALQKYKELYDNSPTSYFTFSDDATILALNFAAAKLAGGERDGMVDTSFKPLMSKLDGTRFEEYLKRLFGGVTGESFEVTISKEGCDDVHIVVESVLSTDGKLARANVFDVSERHKAEADRKTLVADLEVALERVKLLSGMLPICLTCKKIRDDDGQWVDVEVYIARYSEATFSKGLCPNCFPHFNR